MILIHAKDNIVLSTTTDMTLLQLASTLGLGTFLGTAAGYEYRRRREQAKAKENEKEVWLEESLDIIGRGAYNIERTRFRSSPDYERIFEELDEFSERLYIKSTNPPDGIPESTVQKVASVSQIYAKATLITEVSSQKEGVELLTEMFEMAQKEDYEALDLARAIEIAMKNSPAFDQFMSQVKEAGAGPDELAEVTKDILSDWDSEDFAQFVLAGGSVEETVEYSMNMFFLLSKDISNRMYDSLQNDRDKITN